MKLPKRLVVEYEDGSRKEVPFNELDRRLQLELVKSGLCPAAPAILQPARNYLLLRWKDGWQEVIGVDRSRLELLRYYVLERMEQEGRMAFQLEDDYPILVLVRRKPKELESLLIVGGSMSAYSFSPETTKREGDKYIQVEYDRAERHMQHEIESVEAVIEEMLAQLETELAKGDTSAEKLLELDWDQRAKRYRELAKKLGIVAMENQDDVYGFMQLMVERLATTKG